MRITLIHLSVVLAGIFTSTSAAVQWSEDIWSIGDTYTKQSVYGYFNNTEETVYHSGFVRKYYTRAVVESWWTSNDSPFPTSPNWRTGFQTLSSDLLQYDQVYTNVIVPSGHQIKVDFYVSLNFGVNALDYFTGTVSGYARRDRNWEDITGTSLFVVGQ